ncbi:MAG TPA: hypothetical protein VE616_20005 [Candidatus Udaeobacter sp.]|jgi:hypothetical protein|nr:hypothetical protein [Candidatus Udaeobacter sp.]
MNKSIMAAIVATAVALPGYTLAQSTPRVDERQEKQDKRIERGLDKGQITKKEARRLEKGQERVDNLEEKALEDGKVTKREKRRIEKAQDTQSQRIRKERHDEQNKRPN